MRLLALATLCCVASAGPADDLLWQARHAQDVRGDPLAAIDLYTRALRDEALAGLRRAEVRLRLARCHLELNQYRLALDQLKPAHFGDDLPRPLRRAAEDARTLAEARLPKAAARPPQEDPEVVRQRRVRTHVAKARTFLDGGGESQAFYHVQQALELDPDDPDARALATELETRLSGVTSFMRDPLTFLRAWTDARTKAVATEAQALLRNGVVHAGAGRFNAAEAAFRKALRAIAESGFAQESDELAELTERVVARWREVRRKFLGDERAEPPVAATPRRTTMPAEFLNLVQRMLDVVSAPDHEYRIVPVTGGATAAPGKRWQVRPERYTLLRDLDSRWTPARFARDYLPRRLRPESWRERGNYLETAGGMLLARNRRQVLDELQKEIKRIEAPAVRSMRTRFLLVSVPSRALPRFEEQFGAFARSDRADSPALFRSIPARFSLDYLCSWLRDEGADVRLDRDLFDVELVNGAPQTLFAAQPLSAARGYEKRAVRGVPVLAGHFGLLLDTYPLRDRTGRTALAMRLVARWPAPPVPRAGTSATPRFVVQEAELFADVEPGSTLVVAGLEDPFAAAAGTRDPDRELLLLWEVPAAAGGAAQPLTTAAGVEISLRELLVGVLDDPGPRGDTQRGFLRQERAAVLRARAAFLERLLREGLGSDEVEIDVEGAVVRVPPARRDDATALVAALERESARSYVVRVHTRAVRTRVFENWARHAQFRLQPFGRVHVALPEAVEPEFLLRSLVPAEPNDLFAPLDEWPALTPLGLQARHALMGRRRTSPSYAAEDDLATATARTLEEGLLVSVRPYTWRGRLRAWVEVETVGLQSEVEERVLTRAVPSYRTALAGTRAAGELDLGDPARPRTVILCRLPHPTASRPQRLTEIVVALSVRPVW